MIVGLSVDYRSRGRMIGMPRGVLRDIDGVWEPGSREKRTPGGAHGGERCFVPSDCFLLSADLRFLGP